LYSGNACSSAWSNLILFNIEGGQAMKCRQRRPMRSALSACGVD